MSFGLYRDREPTRAAHKAAAIHAACFPNPWDAAAFEKLLANPAGVVFFVCEGEQDVAFILLHMVADEAEILSLGVVPEARRQGIASGLLQFAESCLKKEGARRFFLEVSESNISAKELYNKAEYTLIHKRDAYYVDGSNALCLEKVMAAS